MAPNLSFLIAPTLALTVPLFFLDKDLLGARRVGWLATLALDGYYHFADTNASWTQHVIVGLLGVVWLPHVSHALANKPLFLGYGALALFASALALDPPPLDEGLAGFLAWPSQNAPLFNFVHGLAHISVFGLAMLNHIVPDKTKEKTK